MWNCIVYELLSICMQLFDHLRINHSHYSGRVGSLALSTIESGCGLLFAVFEAFASITRLNWWDRVI